MVIPGPTGSGKTALSLALAEHFHGEIVNCDSVAVYRDFVIGTAKPTPEERQRVPHHLLDVVDPTHYTTAGEYARMARGVLHEIAGRGNLPMVVGGTGLYLRALIDGLFAGPERSEELRERLRSRATEKGPEHIHRILRRLDPEAAARIHANDLPKVIRAVEVCMSARRPLTEQWRSGRDPLRSFQILRLGLDPPRPKLYERINQRVLDMFAAGLVEETKALLQKYGPSARPLASIGYRETVQLLKGEITKDAAIAAVQQAHRNYAKRQMTWFRREREVHWLTGFGSEPEMQQQASVLLERRK